MAVRFAGVAHTASSKEDWSMLKCELFMISFVEKINDPVGLPVLGIKKWSIVNLMIREEFEGIKTKVGLWMVIVLARVSQVAVGLRFYVLVNEQFTGGLSSKVKSYGTFIFIELLIGIECIGHKLKDNQAGL